LDAGWRRLAALQAQLVAGDEALDVCCGTGDLTFSLLDTCPEAAVTGLDFTPAMLDRARDKAAARERRGLPVPRAWLAGDLLHLPFEDRRFAAVSVGWGVRNVPDVPRAFAEMTRVTRPGGRVICLESTQASDPLGRRVHSLWMGRVVPLLGGVIAADPSAYAYLPASVVAFPRPEELAAIMSRAGLVQVRYRLLGLGAVALHVGEVPA